MMNIVDVSSVTVGLPVSDLSRVVQWYQHVFGLGDPDLPPAASVLEFRVGPVWLQLSASPVARSGAEPVTRFGVANAAAERDRLSRLGVPVGALEHVDGAVEYFDFADADGNRLSLYSVVVS